MWYTVHLVDLVNLIHTVKLREPTMQSYKLPWRFFTCMLARCRLAPKEWYVVIEKCNVEVSKLLWSIYLSLSRFCFSSKCYFWRFGNLIELTCMTTSFQCIPDYLPDFLHRVKGILRYIGLHVSSSVAHFVWKIKQFEFHFSFHSPWHEGDCWETSRTWKRRFILCFWGLNNQYVKRSENKCKLRETKGFDIAKINSGRHVCLPQEGTNVVAPY